METINIPDEQYPRPYWPQNLKKTGYIGELTIFEGFSALVIPKPNTPSKDIAKDLKNLAQHFEYKADIEAREVKAEER